MRRKGAEMCWMCDHPEATAEEYLDEVYGIMLMHGWAVQHVECERRPFAYTVGLTPARLARTGGDWPLATTWAAVVEHRRSQGSGR